MRLLHVFASSYVRHFLAPSSMLGSFRETLHVWMKERNHCTEHVPESDRPHISANETLPLLVDRTLQCIQRGPLQVRVPVDGVTRGIRTCPTYLRSTEETSHDGKIQVSGWCRNASGRRHGHARRHSIPHQADPHRRERF